MFNKTKLAAALVSLAALGGADAATVQGKITDEKGAPVVGAEVRIEGSSRVAISDAQGQYKLEDVDPQHVHLHVYSVNHVHGDREFNNIEASLTADFTLTSSVYENIVVTANGLPRSVLESITPVSVISADELRKKQAPTLGETLKGTPGVHSSYFGPVASSPIIRGTDGPRVKLLQNGLDMSDVSRVGADHNVASEASTATQIEVLRGPATLQYGLSLIHI